MNKAFLSSFLLRLGLGVVFLIFGVGKFRGDIWAQTIPNLPFVQSLPFSSDVVVIIIGVVEVLIGLFLLFGLFTRWVALVASIELIMIMILLKFGEVRDMGLLAGSLSLVLTGSSFLSLDRVFFGDEAS
ncbi:MAG: DoxX family membrane protein [Nanoarchaeota archaeon]|nr:DoxX family membrane protein [Nanoarchaeota archaeon]